MSRTTKRRFRMKLRPAPRGSQSVVRMTTTAATASMLSNSGQRECFLLFFLCERLFLPNIM